jgi:hypothetical protein
MRRGTGVLFVIAASLALFIGACGGDTESSVTGAPTLRTSPIPTVPLPTPTPVDCSVPVALDMPEDFPEEIPVPPEYVPTEVERQPHLRVVGLAMPPLTGTEPPHGIVMTGVLDNLQTSQGWAARLNQRVEGLDFDFTAPDGRVLHVNSAGRIGCPDQVVLTYDVLWIESGAGEGDPPGGGDPESDASGA